MFEMISNNPVQMSTPHRHPEVRFSVDLLTLSHQLKGVTDGTN